MIFLYRLADAFAFHKAEYALAGGQAVGLHGALRATYDVDIVVGLDKKNLRRVEEALMGLGMMSRQPVDAGMMAEFREEYIAQKNLKAWSFYNPADPSEVVDILIAHDLKRMRTKTIRSAGRLLRVVSKKDLIAMKQAAGRPQDLEDIKALEAL